jgi:F-type H+-transporting ATPase subunit delta
MLSVVATRYAKALVDVVTDPKTGLDPAAAGAQLRSVAEVVEPAGDLRNVLLSPAVSPSRKRAVLAKLLAPLGLYKQVLNFLFVVIDHRRVQDIASIVEAYDTLLDERLGLVRADVVSAHPLVDGQQASLEAEISRVAGRKAKLKFSTDPALVAGVVARIGSTVYDGSVRGQLDRLRTKLARA